MGQDGANVMMDISLYCVMAGLISNSGTASS